MAEVESNSSSPGKEGNISDGDEGKEKGGANFECNICFDTAKDAVISLCGHLFCWPCLHQWLETRPTNQTCPVCKAAISKDKVIPLYGRGSTKNEDPREKLPPRPPGQRTEAPEQNNHGFFPGFSFGDGEGGFHFHFGIGAFPFGFFNLGLGGGQGGANGQPELDQNLPRYVQYFLAILAFIFYMNVFFS